MRVLIDQPPILDPMDGLPHDLAVLQTCLMRATLVWRRSRETERQVLVDHWPAMAEALEDLVACPDLVTLLTG